MGNVVLVDSTILIGLLRRGLKPAAVLDRWAGPRILATCGMVRLEVVRGIQANRIRRDIETLLSVMLNIPTDNRLWGEAAELAWQLDRKGLVLPAQDILIGAAARRIDADILTDDAHFQRIPGIRIASGLDDLLGNG